MALRMNPLVKSLKRQRLCSILSTNSLNLKNSCSTKPTGLFLSGTSQLLIHLSEKRYYSVETVVIPTFEPSIKSPPSSHQHAVLNIEAVAYTLRPLEILDSYL